MGPDARLHIVPGEHLYSGGTHGYGTDTGIGRGRRSTALMAAQNLFVKFNRSREGT